jgi:hypothetical protein
MFDGPANDQSKSQPEKVIHEPSDIEAQHVAVALMKMGIAGADRAFLVYGKKAFEEDWVSDEVKNWVAVAEHDAKQYEEADDPLDRKLFATMVELDYKVLRRLLIRDAAVALKEQEEKENGISG